MFSRLDDWFQAFRTFPLESLIQLLLFLSALLLSLMLHEIGHGFVAFKCGDPTAKMLGRLTLDPRKHLDPIGAVCMFFLRFGWAKPVPVNPGNFRNRKRDMILVSFAGIFVNLMLFLVSCFLLCVVYKTTGILIFGGTELMTSLLLSYYKNIWAYVQLFLSFMLSFNISLAVFNLIPVPPLDGFRLANQILFRGRLQLSQQTMMIIHLAFLALCLFGVLDHTLSTIINFCVSHVFNFFISILG